MGHVAWGLCFGGAVPKEAQRWAHEGDELRNICLCYNKDRL